MGNNNFFKLQLWSVLEEDGEGFWCDFYLDVTKIIGWYVTEEEDGLSIKIFTSSTYFWIKKEKHIQDYLLKNCYPSTREVEQ